jgi:cytochrome c oxidase subunit 2
MRRGVLSTAVPRFAVPRLLTRHVFLWAGALLTCLVTGVVCAQSYDMPVGVTEISHKVFGLHRLMFWCCVAIGVGVFSVMFYSIIAHRKSKGHKAAQFHESTTVEIIWTAIPFLILILMAIPATKTLIEMSDTSQAELTIKVVGSQWKWQYSYLQYQDDNTIDLDFLSILSTPREQFETPLRSAGLFPLGVASFEGERKIPQKNGDYLLEVDNPVLIPTGKKVRFLVTSNDVIHSWWMPDFGIKQDAIPGFINETWTKVPVGKEGIYRGKCTELCGKDHAFMPIVVKAVPESEFAQWLADSQAAQKKAKAEAANSVDAVLTQDELMTLGEKEYLAKCSACHQANGQGLPPTFPALKGSAIATTPEGLATHINIVRNGKNMMPAFKDTLTPKVMAAIITYERNAWGNDTDELVQPKDVIKDAK